MTRPPPREHRLSMEERAERRDWVLSRGRDRFSALLRVLQGGQQLPIEPRRRIDDVDWERVRWIVFKVALGLAVLFGLGLVGYSIWRDAKVDTWSGPDASVQSGQRLRDCLVVNRLPADETLPSWVRFEGAVYRRGRTSRALDDTSVGVTGYPETGYSLGPARLLLGPEGSGQLLMVVPPSPMALVYEPTPECR